MQTERELLDEWYAESLDLLNGATDAQLEALGGRHEAIERLEAEHKARLAGIDVAARTMTLEGVLGAGADILGALGSTNAKALKMSQGFAAAEAWISTLKGAAKELEKGTFGFASAAAVITKGAAFVAAIKGTSAGGSAGGGAGSTSAPAAAPETPLRVSVAAFDPSQLYTGESIQRWFDAIQKEAGNRGIQWVPV